MVQLDLFRSQIVGDAVKNRSDLDNSIEDLNSLVSDVHDLSHRLHSAQLDHIGLAAAIRDLCRQISHSYGLAIDFQGDATPARFTQDVSLCFYRVAQEALNNVVKHSPVKQCAAHAQWETRSSPDAGSGFGGRI